MSSEVKLLMDRVSRKPYIIQLRNHPDLDWVTVWRYSRMDALLEKLERLVLEPGQSVRVAHQEFILNNSITPLEVPNG
jgi:hypothetical protein